MLEREGEREYTITREEERKRELTSRERRHELFQRLMLDDKMGVKMGEGFLNDKISGKCSRNQEYKKIKIKKTKKNNQEYD